MLREFDGVAVEAMRLCALGYHAWVPWLAVEDQRKGGMRYSTWCTRDGCDAIQYAG